MVGGAVCRFKVYLTKKGGWDSAFEGGRQVDTLMHMIKI